VLRTSRTTGMSVLTSYLNAQELGLDEPLSKRIYANLADMTMADVVACQQKWVKGRTYIYGILGDAKDLDLNYLKSLGTVEQVSLDEIFGYK
jgi:hypothetical protein